MRLSDTADFHLFFSPSDYRLGINISIYSLEFQWLSTLFPILNWYAGFCPELRSCKEITRKFFFALPEKSIEWAKCQSVQHFRHSYENREKFPFSRSPSCALVLYIHPSVCAKPHQRNKECIRASHTMINRTGVVVNFHLMYKSDKIAFCGVERNRSS